MMTILGQNANTHLQLPPSPNDTTLTASGLSYIAQWRHNMLVCLSLQLGEEKAEDSGIAV